MWIPTAIYERLPQFWLLIGLLFMTSGVFLGFEYWLSFVYFFVGLGCAGWSTRTLWLRTRNRQAPMQVNEAAAGKHQPLEDKRQDPVPNL